MITKEVIIMKTIKVIMGVGIFLAFIMMFVGEAPKNLLEDVYKIAKCVLIGAIATVAILIGVTFDSIHSTVTAR